MKTSKIVSVLCFVLIVGCGKKDPDKASSGAPPAAGAPAAPAAGAAAPAATPPAAAPTPAAPTAALTAADVPPECKPFMDALEALGKCEKIPAADRESMRASNQKMLKAMVDLHDTKASIDGCNAGLPTVQQALKTAGC